MAVLAEEAALIALPDHALFAGYDLEDLDHDRVFIDPALLDLGIREDRKDGVFGRLSFLLPAVSVFTVLDGIAIRDASLRHG